MTLEEQREVVSQLYLKVGIKPVWDQFVLQDTGVVYDGKQVALKPDFFKPYIALHDLAHWLVASDDRKTMINFGLGCAPHVSERHLTTPVVIASCVDHEESLASMLNAILAQQLFGEGSEVVDSLALITSSHNSKDEYYLWLLLDELKVRGFVNDESKVQLVHNQPEV